MTDRSKPRIVCAAIRSADGYVMLGIRHYSPDMWAQINACIWGEKFHHRLGDDQGFVDQHGRYYTRAEAYRIALANGQIFDERAIGRKPDGDHELYSEALY